MNLLLVGRKSLVLHGNTSAFMVVIFITFGFLRLNYNGHPDICFFAMLVLCLPSVVLL